MSVLVMISETTLDDLQRVSILSILYITEMKSIGSFVAVHLVGCITSGFATQVYRRLVFRLARLTIVPRFSCPTRSNPHRTQP
jgi:hypothetical protein